jgi:hypothetical protein
MACVAAPASGIRVVPSDRPPTFSWADPAQRRIVLGILPAEAELADFQAAAAVRLTFSSSEPSRWPQQTTLTIRKEGHLWQVSLTPSQSKAGIELRAAPGTYELMAESARHRRATQQVTLTTTADIAFTLLPLPQLSGRVVSRTTNEPIAGAGVTLPTGEVIAVSNGNGRFAFDADPDHWPESVTIGAGGFGDVSIPVPRARVALDGYANGRSHRAARLSRSQHSCPTRPFRT